VAEVEARTLEFAEGDDGNIDDEHDDANTDDDGSNANAGDEGNDATIHHDTNRSSHPDMFDPRCWDGLDPKIIDILLSKVPKRELSIKHGPRDKKILEGFLHRHAIESSQMEKHVTKNGLYTTKSLTKYFVFATSY
jgi:hypothetical protein